MSQLSFELHSEPEAAMLKLSGELLGGEQSQHLDDELTRLIGEPQRIIALEMSGVWFINSSGLGLLVRLHLRVRNAGKNFLITRPHANLRKIFSTTRLTDVLDISDDGSETGLMK